MYINESRFVIGLENTPFTGVCSHFPTQKFDRTGAVKGLTCFLKAFCELKKKLFTFILVICKTLMCVHVFVYFC